MNFWAKTTEDGQPGISVHDHCINVGCMAEAIISAMPECVRRLLPQGSATLAAAHDVGKITLGFQAKCPAWLAASGLSEHERREASFSVSDHALVSQFFLQRDVLQGAIRLWAVAVGAHHGRVKGRRVNPAFEAREESMAAERMALLEQLVKVFGELPTTQPALEFDVNHSDLWLLAGLITFADWMGSNEEFFSPYRGIPLDAAREASRQALAAINWPGAGLRKTSFGESFADGESAVFIPNSLQRVVADAAVEPTLIIVEGPMGCGKTEAALFAAQQLISSEQNRGIYFALPTQVTSNRIHERVAKFLSNTVTGDAHIRLAHSHAWLNDDFVLRVRPTSLEGGGEERESIREARSWFASAKQALLSPYGVGTIDQALMGVIAVKHFFLRKFALAGKVVILDEVHSYDIYTSTLIGALVKELLNLRCTVIILSATLTAARRKELLCEATSREEGAPTAYPLVSVGVRDQAARHLEPEWTAQKKIHLRSGEISETEVIKALV